MPYTLQQLSDFEDIRTLKHRYFRGIDTADTALLRELFTDDVSIDYRGGEYRVTLRGRDNLLEFLANSFSEAAVAMHHGHMPEITLTGEHTAEALWYLEDIFISLEARTHTTGTALYRDRYVRNNGSWRIAHSEYDRVIELVQPLRDDITITSHHLAKAGRRLAERTDISHMIQWTAKS